MENTNKNLSPVILDYAWGGEDGRSEDPNWDEATIRTLPEDWDGDVDWNAVNEMTGFGGYLARGESLPGCRIVATITPRNVLRAGDCRPECDRSASGGIR